MPDVETLQYNIESQAQLQAMERAIRAFSDMSDEYKDIADDLDDVTKEADKAEKEMSSLTKVGGKLKGAFSGLGGLITGGLGALAGLAGGAIASTRQWALGVEDLSNKFSIGLDNASALATSWKLAGVEAETGEAAILGFQGRLIDELEAQKEAAKEVAGIQKERASVINDMAKAEQDHLKTLTDLEAERGEISGSGIAERRAQQQEELATLSKDHARFLDQQRAAEEKESRDFEQIWEDRARTYEQKAEQLRNDLKEKNRSASTAREYLAIQKDFSQKQKLLQDSLQDENSKQLSAHEQKLADLRNATNQEKEMLAEKSQAVNEAADADVAKIQEANARSLASLEERIAAEKDAFADRTTGFNEQLAGLSEAEVEAQQAGAGLQFVMSELGVDLTDAEGNIRPVNELMWDMKDALNNMEDGARKAAIISDLGWEDLATWIGDGADATEAMTFAQDNNLVVTREYLDTIKEQNRLMAEAQLKLQGVAMDFASSETVTRLMTTAVGWLNDAIDIGIGIWDQARTILNLLWEKGKEEGWFDGLIAAFEKVVDWVGSAGESLGQLFSIFGTEGGAASLGEGLLGALPGFETGTRSVPGNKPMLSVLHPGEEVRTRAQVLSDRSGGGMGGGGVTLNVSGNIYGVTDLENTVAGAIDKYDRSRTGGL